jgi:hypothetical protein
MLTIREALNSGEIPANQYAYPDNRRYAVHSITTGERLGIVVRLFQVQGEFLADTFGGNTFQVSGQHELRQD